MKNDTRIFEAAQEILIIVTARLAHPPKDYDDWHVITQQLRVAAWIAQLARDATLDQQNIVNRLE